MTDIGGPAWLSARRQQAWEQFCELLLPSESEEVWRYSPIDQLDLDAYQPVSGNRAPAAEATLTAVLAGLAEETAVVTVRNGRPPESALTLAPGVTVGPASRRDDGAELVGAALRGGDALVRLHEAFVPDILVVDVDPGTVVANPLVVLHWCDAEQAGSSGSGAGTGPAVFPHTVVRLGRGAQLHVVEVVAGAGGELPALLLPVTELGVDDGAHLSYASLQIVGARAWTIGRLGATVAQDASLRAFTAGLGGDYDRLRSDVEARGKGASTELCSVYVGTGTQVHDIRTLQDHLAPFTVSDLLCKGAVAGSARSIYTGLIRVRPGAVRTEAMQSNHNLVLGEDAHADSVPNLEIEENDVRCSHASSVGPVDEDQRFYLESRGVPPWVAERLIVLGFFDDVIRRCPVGAVRGRLRREVGARLSRALGDPSLGDPSKLWEGARVAAGRGPGGAP